MNKRAFLLYSSLLALLLFLTACGSMGSAQTNDSPFDNTPPVQQPGMTPAVIATGTFHEYPLPQSKSGLMRPTLDAKGRLWFGEMGHNYLTVFDPQTQAYEQMVPPDGAAGIMGVAAAKDGSIWFAEQYANYIGHYFPATKTYSIYRLPKVQLPDTTSSEVKSLPTAPNDLVLDAQGNVWFTEMNSDSIGMLNSKSGTFTHYPLEDGGSIQKFNPYGITIDPKGKIWFTQASTNQLGSLDPATGTIQIIQQPDPNPLMEIVSDKNGIIWATSFNAGLLVRYDPATGKSNDYYAPHSGSNAGGLYGITISPQNEVWVAVTAENQIARFDQKSGRFVCYNIPTEGSLPLGVAAAKDGAIWYTAAGKDQIGILQPGKV